MTMQTIEFYVYNMSNVYELSNSKFDIILTL